MEEKRFYREQMGGSLDSFLLKIKETDLWIALSPGSYNPDLFARLETYLKDRRLVLEAYLEENPDFHHTLKPLPAKVGAPGFIEELGQLSFKAGTGPMAGVAGAFSKLTGDFLLKEGIKEIIVENGGDIFCSGLDLVKTGIYAGQSPFSQKIQLIVKADKKEYGLASSSGSFGHSISFGKADLVTIISPNVILADFYATSFCNLIQKKEDLEVVIEEIKKIEEISGALLIMDDKLAAFGNLEIKRG